MNLQTLELIEDFKSMSDDELGETFTARTRDDDFARIGAALISKNAPEHWKVWRGFEICRERE